MTVDGRDADAAPSHQGGLRGAQGRGQTLIEEGVMGGARERGGGKYQDSCFLRFRKNIGIGPKT